MSHFGKVLGGAEMHGGRSFEADSKTYPRVSNLERAVARDEHVGRFEVAMNNIRGNRARSSIIASH